MSADAIQPEPPPGVKEKRLESRFPIAAAVQLSWIGVRDEVVTHPGTVLDHSGHGLGLKMETRVPVGTMLWIRDVEGELVKAAVRFSRNHEKGDWHTGVRLVHREMRGAGREPVRGAAELKWPDHLGNTTSTLVHVIDLSDGGVGAASPVEVAQGQSVQLIGEQFECFCVVRYCQAMHEGGYRLGLLFAREPHDRVHGRTADWLD